MPTYISKRYKPKPYQSDPLFSSLADFVGDHSKCPHGA